MISHPLKTFYIIAMHISLTAGIKSVFVIENCPGIPTENNDTNYNTRIIPCDNPLHIQHFVNEIMASPNEAINSVKLRISCNSIVFLKPLLDDKMLNYSSDDYNCVQQRSTNESNHVIREKAILNIFDETVKRLPRVPTLLIADEKLGINRNAYFRLSHSNQIDILATSCKYPDLFLNSPNYTRIFVLCGLQQTSHILEIAKEFGLFNDPHSWLILTDQIQPIEQLFKSINPDAIWDALIVKFPSKYRLWADLQVHLPGVSSQMKPPKPNKKDTFKFRTVRISKKCREHNVTCDDIGSMPPTKLVSIMENLSPDNKLFNCTFHTSLKAENPLVITSSPRPTGVEFRLLDALQYSIGYQVKYVEKLEHNVWTPINSEDHDTNSPIDFGAPLLDYADAHDNTGHLSLPIYLTRYTAVIRTPSVAIGADSYIQPFALSVWGVIFLVTLGSAFLWAAVRTIYDRLEAKRLTFTTCLSTLWQTSYDIFCTIIEQGIPDVPDQASARIILATINLQTVLVTTCYSSILISFLTDSRIIFPFTSLEEFVATRDYRFIAYKGDTFLEDLEMAKGGIYQQIYNGKKYQVIEDNKTNIWDNVLKEKKAHVALYVVNQLKTGYDNNFTTSIAHVSRVSRSFYFRKNFPHQRLLTLTAHKLVEAGIMSRFIRDFSNSLHYRSGMSENFVGAIGLERMFFLMEIIGFGVIVSLVVLVIEILFYASKYGSYWKDAKNMMDSSKLMIYHRY